MSVRRPKSHLLILAATVLAIVCSTPNSAAEADHAGPPPLKAPFPTNSEGKRLNLEEEMEFLAGHELSPACRTDKFELKAESRFSVERVARGGGYVNREAVGRMQESNFAIQKSKLQKLDTWTQVQLSDLAKVLPYYKPSEFDLLVRSANPEAIDEAHRLWVKFKFYDVPDTKWGAPDAIKKAKEKNVQLARKAAYLLDTIYPLDLNQLSGIYDYFFSRKTGETLSAFYTRSGLFREADNAKAKKLDPDRYIGSSSLGMNAIAAKESRKCFNPNVYHWTPMKFRAGLKSLLWREALGIPSGDLSTQIETAGATSATTPGTPPPAWLSHPYLPEAVKAHIQDTKRVRDGLKRQHDRALSNYYSNHSSDPNIKRPELTEKVSELDQKIEKLESMLAPDIERRIALGKELCQQSGDQTRELKIWREQNYKGELSRPDIYDPLKDPKEPFIREGWDPSKLDAESYTKYLGTISKTALIGHRTQLKKALDGLMGPPNRDPKATHFSELQYRLNYSIDRCEPIDYYSSDYESTEIFSRVPELTGPQLIQATYRAYRGRDSTGQEVLAKEIKKRQAQRDAGTLNFERWPYGSDAFPWTTEGKMIDWKLITDHPGYEQDAAKRLKMEEAQNLAGREGERALRALVPGLKLPTGYQNYDDPRAWYKWAKETAGGFYNGSFHTTCISSDLLGQKLARQQRRIDQDPALAGFKEEIEKEWQSELAKRESDYKALQAKLEGLIKTAEELSKQSAARVALPTGGNWGDRFVDPAAYTPDEILHLVEAGDMSKEVACRALKYPPHLLAYYNLLKKDIDKKDDPKKKEFVAGQIAALENMPESQLAEEWKWYQENTFDGGPKTSIFDEAAGRVIHTGEIDGGSAHFEGTIGLPTKLPDFKTTSYGVFTVDDPKAHWVLPTKENGYGEGFNLKGIDPRFRSHVINGRMRLDRFQSSRAQIAGAANPTEKAREKKESPLPFRAYVDAVMQADSPTSVAMLATPLEVDPSAIEKGKLEFERSMLMIELDRLSKSEPNQIFRYSLSPNDPKRMRLAYALTNSIRSIDLALAKKSGKYTTAQIAEHFPTLAEPTGGGPENALKHLDEYSDLLAAERAYTIDPKGGPTTGHESPYDEVFTRVAAPECEKDPTKCAKDPKAMPWVRSGPTGYFRIESEIGGLPAESRNRIGRLHPLAQHMLGSWLGSDEPKLRYDCNQGTTALEVRIDPLDKMLRDTEKMRAQFRRNSVAACHPTGSDKKSGASDFYSLDAIFNGRLGTAKPILDPATLTALPEAPVVDADGCGLEAQNIPQKDYIKKLFYEVSDIQILNATLKNPLFLKRFLARAVAENPQLPQKLPGIFKQLCQIPNMTFAQVKNLRNSAIDELKKLVKERKPDGLTFTDTAAANFLGFLIGALEDLGRDKADPLVSEWQGGPLRFDPSAVLLRQEKATALASALERQAATDASKDSDAATRLATLRQMEQYFEIHHALVPAQTRIALLADKPLGKSEAEGLKIPDGLIQPIPAQYLEFLKRGMSQYSDSKGAAVEDAAEEFKDVLLVPNASTIANYAMRVAPGLVKEMSRQQIADEVEKPLIDEIVRTGTLDPKNQEQQAKLQSLIGLEFSKRYSRERAALTEAMRTDPQAAAGATAALKKLEETYLPKVAASVTADLYQKALSAQLATAKVHDFKNLDELYSQLDKSGVLEKPEVKAALANLKGLTGSDHSEMEIAGEIASRAELHRKTQDDLGGYLNRGAMPECLRQGLKAEVSTRLKDMFSGENMLSSIQRAIKGEWVKGDEAGMMKMMLLGKDLSREEIVPNDTRNKAKIDGVYLTERFQYQLMGLNLSWLEIRQKIQDTNVELQQVRSTMNSVGTVNTLPEERKKRSEELGAKRKKLESQLETLKQEQQQTQERMRAIVQEAQGTLADNLSDLSEKITADIEQRYQSWVDEQGNLARVYAQHCLNWSGVNVHSSGSQFDESDRSVEVATVEEFKGMHEFLTRGREIAAGLLIPGSPMNENYQKLGKGELVKRFLESHPNRNFLSNWIAEAKARGISEARAKELAEEWLRSSIDSQVKRDRVIEESRKTVEEMKVYDPRTKREVPLGIQWNGHNWKVADPYLTTRMTPAQKSILDEQMAQMSRSVPTATNPLRNMDLQIAQKHGAHPGSKSFLYDENTAVEVTRDTNAATGYRYELVPKSEKQKEMAEVLSDIRKKMTELQFAEEKMVQSMSGLIAGIGSWIGQEGIDYRKYKDQVERIINSELPGLINKLRAFGDIPFEEDPNQGQMVGKTAREAAIELAGFTFEKSIDHLTFLQESHERAAAAGREAAVMAAFIALDIATWGQSVPLHYAWAARVGFNVLKGMIAANRIHAMGKVFGEIGGKLNILRLDARYAAYGEDYWKDKIKKGRGEFKLPGTIDHNQNNIPDYYETGEHPWVLSDPRQSEKSLYQSLAVFGGAKFLDGLGLLSPLLTSDYSHPLNFGISGCLTELAQGKSLKECLEHGVHGTLMGLSMPESLQKLGLGGFMKDSLVAPFLVNMAYLSALDAGNYTYHRYSHPEMAEQGEYWDGLIESQLGSLGINVWFSGQGAMGYVQKEKVAAVMDAISEIGNANHHKNVSEYVQSRVEKMNEAEFKAILDALPGKQKEVVEAHIAAIGQPGHPADLPELIKLLAPDLVRSQMQSALAHMDINTLKGLVDRLGRTSASSPDVAEIGKVLGIPPHLVGKTLENLQGWTGSNYDTFSNAQPAVQEAMQRAVGEQYFSDLARPSRAENAKSQLRDTLKHLGPRALEHTDINALLKTLDLNRPIDKDIAKVVAHKLGIPEIEVGSSTAVAGIDAERFTDFLKIHKPTMAAENRKLLFLGAFETPEVLGEMIAKGDLELRDAARVFGRERVAEGISQYRKKNPNVKTQPINSALSQFSWANSDVRAFDRNFSNRNGESPTSKKKYEAEQKALMRDVVAKRPETLTHLPLTTALERLPAEPQQMMFDYLADKMVRELKAETGKDFDRNMLLKELRQHSERSLPSRNSNPLFKTVGDVYDKIYRLNRGTVRKAA